MATGTMKWFPTALLGLGNKLHNLSSDVLKLGIVTTATVPSISTADPCWGAGGTTNFSTNQVATGGTQYTGPKTLSSVTWTNVSNVPTLRATDIAMTIDASGFTNGAYGIIYNDTATNKNCLGWVELSSAGTLSLVAGGVTIDWGGAGTDLLTITQS
jgi:hypothetical protein